MHSHQGRVPAAEFDSTLALLREGYDFVANRCRALESDAFTTRLMLRTVICARGAEWAEVFYGGDRFTRKRAMPVSTVRLLQDIGSVQTLDGAAHRHRKTLFLGLLLDEQRISEMIDRFERQWRRDLSGPEGSQVLLLREVTTVLGRAALRWCGIPLELVGGDRMVADLDAMVANAGRFDPRTVVALFRRRRAERLIVRIVDRLRSGNLDISEWTPARKVASFRTEAGRVLDREPAAVEILNMLRPIVAVGRYLVFCALALHRHPGWRERFESGDWTMLEAFVEEVRRSYPFFPFVAGRARSSFEAHGHTFREGDWMLLDLYGTDHHPALFPEPEIFRPERSLSWRTQGYDFIPQGAGDLRVTHRCPGEAITVRLMMSAVQLMVEDRMHVVDEHVRLSRTQFPPMPPQGLRMRFG